MQPALNHTRKRLATLLIALSTLLWTVTTPLAATGIIDPGIIQPPIVIDPGIIIIINQPPTISPIADQSTAEDTTSGFIQFTIGDDASVDLLQLSASSDNQALVPNANIQFTPIFDSTILRSITITPAANMNGSARITITATDRGRPIRSTSTSFLFTVSPVDDPPSISQIPNQTILQNGTTGPLPFTLADIDTPLDQLVLQGFSSNPDIISPSGIVFGGSGADRTVTVTPIPNLTGTSRITIRAGNGGKVFANSTFTVVVNPNLPPTISPLEDITIDEDTSTPPLPFTVADPDTAFANLIVTAASSNPDLIPVENIIFANSGISPVIGPNFRPRTVTVVPAPNKFGSSLITLIVSDGNSAAAEQFVVTVRPVNDAPTMTPISDQVVNEDSSTPPIPFTIADIDDPAAKLVLSATSTDPKLIPDANIVIGGAAGDRTVTITPAPNTSGSATIILEVTDGLLKASQRFNVTVQPVNDAPTITALADQTIDEDTSTAPLPFAIADVDSPLSSLTVSASSSNPDLVPTTGILIGLNAENRTVVVTPAANQFGRSVITLTVSDGVGTASTSFAVTVNPVNDAPQITRIADISIDEDTSTGPIPLQVSDVETPAANLTVSASSSNPDLVPTTGILIGLNQGARTLTLTPAPNQTGSATITVSVNDGVATASTQFTLTVNPVNDAPFISGIANQTIDEDSSTGPIPFSIGDIDTPAANLSVSASSSNPNLLPSNGILIGLNQGTHTISLTPAANQFGTATVTLTASDGIASASTQFTLTVNPVNDAPFIAQIADVTIDEDSSSGPIPLGIGDIDTPLANLSVSANSSNPDLVPTTGILIGLNQENRSITLVPAPNQNGSAIITVTVSDGALSASTRFTLTVNPVNDAPTISAIADQTIDEDTSTGPIPFSIADIDTPAANLSISANSSNPNLVPSTGILIGLNQGNRVVTVTPSPNQTGSALIILTVGDGQASASTQFLLTVNPVNDGPTIAPIAGQLLGEYNDFILIGLLVADIDSPSQTFSFDVSSNDPQLLPASSMSIIGGGDQRMLKISRNGAAAGNAVVTVGVSDQAGARAATSFAIRVVPAVQLQLSIAREKDQVKVSWPARAGARYQLRATDAVDGVLQDIGPSYVGANARIEHFDTINGAAGALRLPSHRFYRLLVTE